MHQPHQRMHQFPQRHVLPQALYIRAQPSSVSTPSCNSTFYSSTFVDKRVFAVSSLVSTSFSRFPNRRALNYIGVSLFFVKEVLLKMTTLLSYPRCTPCDI